MVFFFNDTATTEIYTLSLHDALPICHPAQDGRVQRAGRGEVVAERLLDHHAAEVASPLPHEAGRRQVLDDRAEKARGGGQDRKSTRLNSSHANISYAVFCLKKNKHHH